MVNTTGMAVGKALTTVTEVVAVEVQPLTFVA
jgi:hypothetical protein